MVVYDPPAVERVERPEQAAVEDAVSDAKYEIERCYLESRELWADLEGLVALKLTVNTDGSVEQAAVMMYDATIHEAAVGCCLADVARTWKLPAPTDGKPYEIEHTIELEADVFKIKFGSSSDVGKPQPASGGEIHRTW